MDKILKQCLQELIKEHPSAAYLYEKGLLNDREIIKYSVRKEFPALYQQEGEKKKAYEILSDKYCLCYNSIKYYCHGL